MKLPRIETTLTASMLVVGFATHAIAQPLNPPDVTAAAAVQIADAIAGIPTKLVKKEQKAEGMSWAEVTIGKVLLAVQMEEFATAPRPVGTKVAKQG